MWHSLRVAAPVAAIAVLALLGMSPAGAATITYDVNIANLTGTLTTDGKTGTLTAKDIKAWDLTITSPPQISPPQVIEFVGGKGSAKKTANSDITSSLVKTDPILTATQSALFFNFNGENMPDRFISFNGTGSIACCSVRLTTQFSEVFAVFVGFTTGAEFFGLTQFGTAALDPPLFADVLADPAPIPAALPLFATGLGGLGLLGWRRKRKAQAIA